MSFAGGGLPKSQEEEVRDMPKYMAIHTFPSPTPLTQAEPVAKAAKALSTADAYWVGSWNQLDEKGNALRIICEWDAKDVESLRKTFAELLKQIPGLPIDGPYAMSKVDGESYR
jgi:hypothetical protein